ncbi:MAG: LysM peptidoglycan-binding domain-containing protein [Burkholderiaceae bacterium]|nr:LysM peptidoglycan-binding domain-containing protein [Burkholderiaceae bacterium]
MRKLSVQFLTLAVAGLACAAGLVFAQPATPPLELAKDAPDRYVVVKGDTLWDISGRFLQKPWRWPEIWELNREEIRDPHWIYPGDVILLDRSGAQPRLRLARSVGSGSSAAGGNLPVEKLSPRVRVGPLTQEAIPTINSTDIEAFLNRPLVVDEHGLASNPRIVATQEGRVFLGRGELAYVRGIEQPQVSEWHIYRSARPLLDPDTREPIAWEALFLGTGKLERPGDPASLRVVATNEEVGTGDRLMAAERALPIVYAPRAPDAKVAGRIVAVYRGLTQVGRNSVVAVNVGKENGIEVGHVLGIAHRGATITDRTAAEREKVVLPDEPVGHLLVFRVFDKIAYGLVMDASQPIAVGDDVANPR